VINQQDLTSAEYRKWEAATS